MLASLVQFKYVQTFGGAKRYKFYCFGFGRWFEVLAKHEQYELFVDKYLTWLENR